MVAFEVVHHGEFVENSEEKKDVKTEVKFKPVNNELSEECTKIKPKVQAFFEKLKKLRGIESSQSFNIHLPAISLQDGIGICERDSAVTSIKSMQRFYNYSCDTLADAVNYLDMFISKVKVKRRYLSCVATAAFFLSTKMNEESEYHPTASDLASLQRHSWKPTDLKRMEKILLEKLGWNLFPSATCLSFIHIIHQMLRLISSEIDMQFFELLVQRSELCMNYFRCASYGASTMAVSITQLCLKETGFGSMFTKFLLLQVQTLCGALHMPGTRCENDLLKISPYSFLSYTYVKLKEGSKISDSKLFDCQCAISEQLELFNSYPSTHPRCLPLPKIVPRPNLIKRPSFYGNTDLPAIEEVSWSSESSEMISTLDNVHQDNCEDIRYIPTHPTKMTQSYCQLVDQCYLKDHRTLFHYQKCNTNISVL